MSEPFSPRDEPLIRAFVDVSCVFVGCVAEGLRATASRLEAGVADDETAGECDWRVCAFFQAALIALAGVSLGLLFADDLRREKDEEVAERGAFGGALENSSGCFSTVSWYSRESMSEWRSG